MDLNLRGSQADAISFDASRNLFRAGTLGQVSKVSELLHAIPMLKADPVAATASDSADTQFTMKVTVQRVAGTVPEAGYYDNNSINGTLSEITNGLTSQDFPVARLGIQFKINKIDSRAGARGTAQDSYEWRTYTAAYAVLRKLDRELAQGNGAANPQNLTGLSGLGSTAASSGDIEIDARNIIAAVTPNGTGAGEGIHCFFGGPLTMKKLMSTASGQNGSSGWKVDRRRIPEFEASAVCVR